MPTSHSRTHWSRETWTQRRHGYRHSLFRIKKVAFGGHSGSGTFVFISALSIDGHIAAQSVFGIFCGQANLSVCVCILVY